MPLFRRGERASTLDLLVAGLGNPGREYERTRHNAGWLVMDELAGRHGGSFRSKFSGQLSETRLDDLKLALLKPETYMNVSGKSIGAGRLQAKFGGGLAGHNGLRSIAQTLGTNDFLRLRIGVGRPGRGDRRSVADYVLGGFEPEVDLDELIGRSADAVETMARDGLEEAQRRYN